MEDDETLRKRIELVRPLLNEAQLRQYYAAEAKAMGRGGVSAVARAAGCSRSTVRAGARDLESGAGHDPSSGRVRRPGEEALRWLKVVQILEIGRKNAGMRIAYPVS